MISNGGWGTSQLSAAKFKVIKRVPIMDRMKLTHVKGERMKLTHLHLKGEHFK